MSDSTSQENLPSQVFEFEKLLVEPTPMGEKRRFFFAPTATLDQFVLQMTTLDPGQSPHPPHRHPDEEMIMIKDGTLEIRLDDKVQRAGPGSAVFVAPQCLHGWTNVGPARASYFVLRWTTAKTGE